MVRSSSSVNAARQSEGTWKRGFASKAKIAVGLILSSGWCVRFLSLVTSNLADVFDATSAGCAISIGVNLVLSSVNEGGISRERVRLLRAARLTSMLSAITFLATTLVAIFWLST